jgi:hypothetical protein
MLMVVKRSLIFKDCWIPQIDEWPFSIKRLKAFNIALNKVSFFMGRNLCSNFISITRTRQVWNPAKWMIDEPKLRQSWMYRVIWFKLPSLSFRFYWMCRFSPLLSLLHLPLHHKDRSGWVKERENKSRSLGGPSLAAFYCVQRWEKVITVSNQVTGQVLIFTWLFLIPSYIGERNSQPAERERKKSGKLDNEERIHLWGTKLFG